MEVILLENVKGLGKKLDAVNVSEGYARNYLFPKKLAQEANNKSIGEATSKKQSIQFKKETSKKESEMIKNTVEAKVFEFRLKAKDGKFFGSITAKEVEEKIESVLGLEIDKKKIELEQSIKSPGMYVAKIKLYEGVIANAKIRVIEE